MTLQGCDARLAYLSNKNNTYTPCRQGCCSYFESCLHRHDAHKTWLINDLLPRFHRVFFLNPELGFYVPGGVFLPYTSVDVEGIQAAPPRTTGKVRILHAPTDPAIKGTRHIVEAVSMLQRDYDIEFILVENMTHEEALKTYRTADIIVDQLLAGWYGAFAVECMAMGKLVACYIRDEDLEFIPPSMKRELPLLKTSPDDLAQRLAMAIDRRNDWAEWSEEAVKFVRKWHNPRFIAKAMVEAYKDPDSVFDLQRAVEGFYP
jgi:hypothetical protein